MSLPFDPLTTTASQLATLLSTGTLTSVAIITTYLSQIEAHNHQGANLHAIISTPPRDTILAKAQQLDDERKAGKLRGEFHGIPIVVKDCFVFEESMGLKTTVGSRVFERESVGREGRNAGLIQQLVHQGYIILGTANLTEFCGHAAWGLNPGWSTTGGQTRSAYDPDPPSSENPKNIMDAHCGGSSAGSGVAVSAGFSPLSIGTETGGSHVYPASKAGLYAIRPTLETVPISGCYRNTASFDGPGGMAKTPSDLAVLIENMLLPEVKAERKLKEKMTGSWEGVKVGIVKSTWGLPEQDHEEFSGTEGGKWGSEAVLSRYESLVQVIRDGGGHVVYPADAPPPSTLRFDGKTGHDVMLHEYHQVLPIFCQNFKDPKVKNVVDIIKFREETEMAVPNPNPNQKALYESLQTPTPLSSSEIHNLQLEIRRLATVDGMDKFMSSIDVDLIVSNSDCSLLSFTSGGGYPSATVPLGQLENGLPYGMFILGKRNQEEKILEFMSGFERTMPGCKPPVLKVW